jgi:hypothetical protein
VVGELLSAPGLVRPDDHDDQPKTLLTHTRTPSTMFV